MRFPPGTYQFKVNNDGSFEITSATASEPISTDGLKMIWRSQLPFEQFVEILQGQGYVTDDGSNRWAGNPRELRALYEVLRGKHLSPNVSRRKFFTVIANTFDLPIKDVSSLQFEDWEFETELDRLSDIFQ